MAENTYKSNTFKKPEKEKKGKSSKSQGKFSFAFFTDPRFKLAFGFFLPTLIGNMIGGTALFALIAYAQVMDEI